MKHNSIFVKQNPGKFFIKSTCISNESAYINKHGDKYTLFIDLALHITSAKETNIV